MSRRDRCYVVDLPSGTTVRVHGGRRPLTSRDIAALDALSDAAFAEVARRALDWPTRHAEHIDFEAAAVARGFRMPRVDALYSDLGGEG